MGTVEFVKQAKHGNKDALVELIMAQKSEYYSLAYVYLRNKDDVLDVMSEMIIILYEKIYTLRKEEIFYSWSKTILVNICKKKLKKSKNIITFKELHDSGYSVDFKEDRMVLENYLSKISKKQQDVIRLRYFLDMDYQTISEVLNIPLGTVKSRVAKGIEKLKDNLKGEYYE